MTDALTDLRCDHLAGCRGGMLSICSTRREVLEAALEAALAGRGELLVEATANQVNQFGGYTGLTPADFAASMRALASAKGVEVDRLLLGADHLGPYLWRGEPAAAAMRKAEDLVQQCVAAGFRKIHLDTGFGCQDDTWPILPPEISAERAVGLCRIAEHAARSLAPDRPRPVYVVGAEVPPPGGSLEDPTALNATPVDELMHALEIYEARFRRAGLESAWQRVVAIVVQPGVDFGDFRAAPYLPEKARALSLFHERLPGAMTYEVHATDYQTAECLSQMVRDHFSLLKAGPCLTHAFRAAVFALAKIESEWLAGRRSAQPSRIREALEEAMLAHPGHWQSHYRGSEETLRYLRSHSLRDRIRYYWGHPHVEAALKRLLENLVAPLPAELVSKNFPELDAASLEQAGSIGPSTLIRLKIQAALKPYFTACR